MNHRSINPPELPKGHISILSPTFRYVPAVKTDLTKTFARIREQRLAQGRKGASAARLKPVVFENWSASSERAAVDG